MTTRTENPTERTGPARARRRRRPRAAVVALAALLAPAVLLSGCGLRVETPAPTAPEPDALEAARERAVDDALAVQTAAEQALASADPASTAVLQRLADDAGVHVVQLGGVYDSGLPDDGPSHSPSATAPDGSPAPGNPPASTADAAHVLSLLADAAGRSGADATTVRDPALARLLTEVTLSRLQDARLLASAAGLPALTAVDGAVPDQLPTGLTAADVTTIVLAEDEAGFAYEVVAAKLSDNARSTAQSRAAVHRARAQQWAELAGLAATGTDPRRVAYDLPDGLSAPGGPAAQAASLEASLASSYASLLSLSTGSDAATTSAATPAPTAAAPPGSASTPTDAAAPTPGATTAPGRPALLALADDAWTSAMSWGTPPAPLPTSTPSDAPAGASASPGPGSTPTPG